MTKENLQKFKSVSMEFVKSIKQSFEYIKPEVITELENLIDACDSELMESVGKILYKYAIQITGVTSNNKLKNSDFKFLENIVLFNGILDLSKFKAENKKTKKTIVIYLGNILASSAEYVDFSIDNIDIKGITNTIENNNVLSNLVNSVTKKITSGNIDVGSLLGTLMTNPEKAKDNVHFKEIFDIVERDIKHIDTDSLHNLTNDLVKMLNIKQ